MQRRSNIQISSLIIFLSILTIIVQFSAYYFFASFYFICGIACIISIISCHIIVEQTAIYSACFQYSVLTLFISLIILALTYLQEASSFLPYSGTMLGIAVINWLFPYLYGYLRNMMNFGAKAEDFTGFYRNCNIIFFAFYLGLILYGSFAQTAFPWAYRGIMDAYNVYPFQAIATQIEDYLYGLIPLGDIITYLLTRILIYVPYGFYIALILRGQSRLSKFFALILLPFLLEVFQYFVIPVRCDIDDLIYALIGGLHGCLLFYVNNLIFRAFTGKDFLAKENDYRFSNGSLHF